MNVFWGKGNILSNYPSSHTNSTSLIYNTCLVPEESEAANPLLLLTVFSLPFPHVQTLLMV